MFAQGPSASEEHACGPRRHLGLPLRLCPSLTEGWGARWHQALICRAPCLVPTCRYAHYLGGPPALGNCAHSDDPGSPGTEKGPETHTDTCSRCHGGRIGIDVRSALGAALSSLHTGGQKYAYSGRAGSFWATEALAIILTCVSFFPPHMNSRKPAVAHLLHMSPSPPRATPGGRQAGRHASENRAGGPGEVGGQQRAARTVAGSELAPRELTGQGPMPASQLHPIGTSARRSRERPRERHSFPSAAVTKVARAARPTASEAHSLAALEAGSPGWRDWQGGPFWRVRRGA